MSFHKLLASLLTIATLATTTTAQVTSRFASYDRTIGNSWLGGAVHAYAGLVTQRSGGYELGNASAELRGTGNLLRASREVFEVIANVTNVLNNGVQSRSGYFRAEVLGASVVNSSFQSSSTFARRSWTFNLFASAPSASVPVGPISITVRGNAGCGAGMYANLLLPAATPSVSIIGDANAYAFANASVGAGIPGFSVGVGIEGRIANQRLAIGATANARSGLSGSATYTLEAITLRLYAYAEAFWQTWTTTLTTWSAGRIVRTLFSI
ncbi:MAG: hypothetical protein IPK26_04645 [Planctomycetes bacterium]|nr:hypothetical protein [Planctomycetota bacterium]